MKLKQAIDKAKRERQRQQPVQTEIVTAKEFSAAQTEEWMPPAYSESIQATLSPQALEQNRCIGLFPGAPAVEFYKVLRTQIQQMAEQNNWKTIMITSALPNEGKTLTAVNLSLTFAKSFNQTILLVDCDLHKQSVKQYLGIDSRWGLVDHLTGNRSLKEIIIWPGVEKMTLISGGKTIDGSAELLGSPKMKALVSEMKNRYPDRFIIFDTPPILNMADAIAFSPLVDCILMVVEEGKTPMPEVQKALELLPREKFLGFVINKKKLTRNHHYGYLYR